jgi:hypothetical protein
MAQYAVGDRPGIHADAGVRGDPFRRADIGLVFNPAVEV